MDATIPRQSFGTYPIPVFPAIFGGFLTLGGHARSSQVQQSAKT